MVNTQYTGIPAMTSPHLKAVIFDVGGVVMRSPFIAISAYERKLGIPQNYLNCSMHVNIMLALTLIFTPLHSVERGSQGAWQKFERGEIPLFEFTKHLAVNCQILYKTYCTRKGLAVPRLPEKLSVNGRDLFGMMMRESNAYDAHIVQAIHRIRAAGKHKVIALTNNFAKADVPASEADFLGWGEGGATPGYLRSLFDDFCDSSTLGMRKPEAEFYMLACKRNGIEPREAVFLDDIGLNLKAARALGMETIHVSIGATFEAVKTLEAKLGIDLTSHPAHTTGCAKL
ncbi:Acyl-CoA dehydrogenase family member 10 [Hypsizygus marmoreus]|uniref:Acyl-CoA dehydrogenase family member 10 n=1 Tax=Hypsizygus marmoreus TaxID=39966 RepID=A0A369JLM4_HYPMA|nr:Acyl-CoA dehydrogenase family member 10 [Hypsizygus marmoreus]